MSQEILLQLAHARPGCSCRVLGEDRFHLDGQDYRVRVPVCRTGPDSGRAVRHLVEVASRVRLVSRPQAQELLRSRLLDPRLLAQVRPAGSSCYTLRSLVELVRSQPRAACRWCGRRFNRLVGPARAATLYRLWGRSYHTLTVLACGPACWQHLVRENLEYLKCQASELALVRAIKRQVKTLKQMVRQRRQGQGQAQQAPPSPGRDSRPATTWPASSPP